MSNVKQSSKPHKKTRREIAERAAIKKQLQEEGVIPPDKPRLNRKKFCTDAEAILCEHTDLAFDWYLRWALLEMLGKGAGLNDRGRDSEAVGVARAIHLALRRREFENEHTGEKITVGQLIEATKDIFRA